MNSQSNTNNLFLHYGRIQWNAKDDSYELKDSHSSDNSDFPKHIFDFCYVDIFKLKNLSIQNTNSKRIDNFSFTLTGGDSTKQYAICRRISYHDKGHYISICMIIISKKPWFELFSDILQIQELIHDNDQQNKFNFLTELLTQPLPDPGNAFKVEIPYKKQLNRAFLKLKRPLRGYGDIDCENLFSSLDIYRIVSLFLDVLQEKKLVVYSETLGKVSSTVRTIAAFLYPFKWQHIFIPLLPYKLLDYCCATIPFLVGTHSSLVDELKKRALEEDVIFVDLDLPIVSLPPREYQSLPRPVKLMGDALYELESYNKNSLEWSSTVTETFMKFFLDVFWEYKKYIVNEKFDKTSFIKTKYTSKEFIENFCGTQMFACFIDERIRMEKENRKDYFDKKAEEYATQGIRGVGKFLGDFLSKAKTGFFAPKPKPTTQQTKPVPQSTPLNKKISVPSINLMDLSGNNNNNGQLISTQERRSLKEGIFNTGSPRKEYMEKPQVLQPYKSNPTDTTTSLIDFNFLNPSPPQNLHQPYQSQPYQSQPYQSQPLNNNNSEVVEIPVREVKEIKLKPVQKLPVVPLDSLLDSSSFLSPDPSLSPTTNGSGDNGSSTTEEMSYEAFAKKFETRQKNLMSIPEENETN